MMDVESSTIVYLRGLLRTAIVDDPEAVAFSGMRRIIEAEIGSSNQIGKASGPMTATAAFLIPTME